jgi:hypothetical protein
LINSQQRQAGYRLLRSGLEALGPHTWPGGWPRAGTGMEPQRGPHPRGGWVGSFEEPGGAYSVAASSKREAYRLARRLWIKRLLDG